MIPLDHELQRMQTSERSQGRNLSDDEFEEEQYERGSELMSTSYAAPKHRAKTTPLFSSGTTSQQPPQPVSTSIK